MRYGTTSRWGRRGTARSCLWCSRKRGSSGRGGEAAIPSNCRQRHAPQSDNTPRHSVRGKPILNGNVETFAHTEAAKHLLRYLPGTVGFGTSPNKQGGFRLIACSHGNCGNQPGQREVNFIGTAAALLFGGTVGAFGVATTGNVGSPKSLSASVHNNAMHFGKNREVNVFWEFCIIIDR